MTKSVLLIEMISLLRRQPGISVSELAQALNRAERTIYRWLNELASDLQTPVCCSDGGYYLLSPPEQTGIDLTPEELLALRLSLKASPFTGASPVGKYAQSAWDKLKDASSSSRLEKAIEMAASEVVNVTNYTLDARPGIAETLQKAINTHSRLRVVYRSQKSNAVKEYTIDPYAVVFRRHSWYVLAFTPEHDKVVQFKLIRFRSLEDTGVKFEPPTDFSVEEHFRFSWEAWAGGEPVVVRVRFSPDVAEMIAETKRHETQIIYPQLDGSIVFEATVSGFEEMAQWIMSYGKDAEVLEPESLKNFILEHAKGMLSVYSDVQQDILKLVAQTV